MATHTSVRDSKRMYENNYVERWEDRKARKKREKPKSTRIGRPKGSGVLANGTASRDPTLLRRFAEAWTRGTTKKIIYRDLGMCLSLQDTIRKELGLPERQPKRGSTTRDHECTVRFADPLYQRMERRCFAAGMSRAKYIRGLIERDLAAYQL